MRYRVRLYKIVDAIPWIPCIHRVCDPIANCGVQARRYLPPPSLADVVVIVAPEKGPYYVRRCAEGGNDLHAEYVRSVRKEDIKVVCKPCQRCPTISGVRAADHILDEKREGLVRVVAEVEVQTGRWRRGCGRAEVEEWPA